MPGYKIITGSDGERYCVPEKCKNQSPFSSDPNCRYYPIKKSTSYDPNDKVGSPGIGAARFVRGEDDLGYIVRFENLATATAAAQVVEIIDQLDTNALDLASFSLGPISFGDVTVTPPDGEAQYTAGVDLRPARNLIVLINAGLDKATGIATWRLTSLDPVTLNLTEDAAAGFLASNVNPPEGEGSVQFNVKPKPGLPTGTQSCNQATIVFDDNAPIDTPPWCTTIDNSPPQSHVLPLPATQLNPVVRLQWDGDDAGAGIATYTVYVSANGGAFTPLVSDTTDTAAIFTGRLGQTYAFCSIATDLVGNVEPKPCPPHADTSIVIGPPPTPTPRPSCVGDCDGDSQVTINELLLMVNAALGNVPASACVAGDDTHDGAITIDEILKAVNNALSGCNAES